MVPTRGAIIPAAVGVDIGCGMMAVETTLAAKQLPDNARAAALGDRAGGAARPQRERRQERSRRVGQAARAGGRGVEDARAAARRDRATSTARIRGANDVNHLGTLGTGNHFIEVCLDERDRVWFMLHSGSRGIGNRIGSYFIELAKHDMMRHVKNLPDEDLAYLQEGSRHFADYVEAVEWAQRYAMTNRQMMMDAVIGGGEEGAARRSRSARAR